MRFLVWPTRASKASAHGGGFTAVTRRLGPQFGFFCGTQAADHRLLLAELALRLYNWDADPWAQEQAQDRELSRLTWASPECRRIGIDAPRGVFTMTWKVKEWLRPASPEQAAQLMAELGPRTRVVGGGTRIKPDPDVEYLIDLSRLPLKGVTVSDAAIRLGSGLSLEALLKVSVLSSLADGLLPVAVRHSYTSLVRNRATLGGEIATADPTSEILAALVAFGASVELLGPEPASLSLSTYLSEVAAHRGKLIVAVSVPTGWTSGGFSRVARTVSDRPIVSAAFAFSGDRTRGHGSLGLVGGGSSIMHFEIEVASDVGIEQAIRAVGAAVNPPSDVRGSAEYRRAVIPVVLRRAVEAALEGVR